VKLIVHVDGGARGNPGPAAAACVVSDPDGAILDEQAELLGRVTNNVAEYRALLLGLKRARALGADEVEVVNDSELIAKQVQGIYKVKHPAMRPLHLDAMQALRGFKRWSVRTVPRAQNAEADALVNAALDGRKHTTSSATSHEAQEVQEADAQPESPPTRSKATLARKHLTRAQRAITDGDLVVGVTFLHLAAEAAIVHLADLRDIATERQHWRKTEAATDLYAQGVLPDNLAPVLELLNQVRKDAGYEGEEPDLGQREPGELLALVEQAVDVAEKAAPKTGTGKTRPGGRNPRSRS
jgi:ribonuclease HI